MRVCQKCNSEVREGSKICRVCGGIVDEVPPPVRTDVEEIVIEVLDETPSPPPSQSSHELDADTADRALGEPSSLPWLCVSCGETLDADFGICWKCGTGVDGTRDPNFKRADDFSAEDFAASVVSAGASIPQELTAPVPHRVEREPEEQAESGAAFVSAWTCPDCNAPLRRIKLIDRTGESHVHDLLSYAAADAERGWFLGRFEEAGQVGARMCTSCGRILLYGEPND